MKIDGELETQEIIKSVIILYNFSMKGKTQKLLKC